MQFVVAVARVKTAAVNNRGKKLFKCCPGIFFQPVVHNITGMENGHRFVMHYFFTNTPVGCVVEVGIARNFGAGVSKNNDNGILLGKEVVSATNDKCK